MDVGMVHECIYVLMFNCFLYGENAPLGKSIGLKTKLGNINREKKHSLRRTWDAQENTTQACTFY